MLATRTKTYAAAAVADADGVKTSFASSTSPVVLTTVDWNGAAIGAAGLLDLPRVVTITRSSAANQYSVAPIIVRYRRGGTTYAEELTPANDDGNDVLSTTRPVDVLLGVDIPAQAGNGGAFTIGVTDICAPHGQTFIAVEAAANGTLHVAYGDADSSPTDAIPVVVANKPCYDIAPVRVLTGAGETTVGVTVYLGK